MSRSTTTLLEAEYGPDPISDPAARPESVWATLADDTEDDTAESGQRVAELEAELSRVRDHRDRLAAKADRVDELERQVERLKDEKRMPIRVRRENPQVVHAGEPTTRQQRREGRLWTYLKRQLF